MSRKRHKNHSAPQKSTLTYNMMPRLYEGGFIILAVIAIFLVISLITYHQADPAWSRTATHEHIFNGGGKAGAWFADLFFYLFGYQAYFFPFVLSYGAIRIFQKRKNIEAFNKLLWVFRILGFILTVVAGSGLAQTHFVISKQYLPSGAGGILGEIVGSYLHYFFNYLGSTLILLGLFFSGITLATGLSWLLVMDNIGKYFLNTINYNKLNIIKFIFWIKNKQAMFLIKKNSLQKCKMEPIIKQEPIVIAKNTALIKIASVQVQKPTIIPSIKSVVSSPLHKQTVSKRGELPAVALLDENLTLSTEPFSENTLEELSKTVEARLAEFGITVKVVAVYPGPVVTRFEMELAAGQKVSKITSLARDLARALSVTRVRVVEIIPGKAVVGLEIPNEEREMVLLREVIESSSYQEQRSPLTIALGKDIAGVPIAVDVAKMPHLLVAGTTGSGKSVGINVMLLSLLYKATPEEIRLILIDPKMLELSIYEGIPHLLTPVVTDMKDAANALKWCVAEMERRYQLMAALGVRNIVGYNHKIAEAEKTGNPLLSPLAPIPGEPISTLSRIPYIVVIIDEFADMMMVVGKKVEELIARIAQKARAAGIHMILATQRPSVDVITGLIKANIPTRIAFQVSSRIDSRTILDQQGAEQLLGHGDMLYLPPGTGIPTRIHGAFVSDDEVHRVVQALKLSAKPQYIEDIIAGGTKSLFNLPGTAELEDSEADELYDQAVQLVIESRKASISNIQRRLKIGYNRAARLIEAMEAAGLVSAMQSNGNREILIAHHPEAQ